MTWLHIFARAHDFINFSGRWHIWDDEGERYTRRPSVMRSGGAVWGKPPPSPAVTPPPMGGGKREGAPAPRERARRKYAIHYLFVPIYEKADCVFRDSSPSPERNALGRRFRMTRKNKHGAGQNDAVDRTKSPTPLTPLPRRGQVRKPPTEGQGWKAFEEGQVRGNNPHLTRQAAPPAPFKGGRSRRLPRRDERKEKARPLQRSGRAVKYAIHY